MSNTPEDRFHLIETRASAQPNGKELEELQGFAYGVGVSIILEDTDVAGTQLVGQGGLIIIVPEFTPHKFAVVGPGRFHSTHIHANDRFITEWLEGPQAKDAGRATERN